MERLADLGSCDFDFADDGLASAGMVGSEKTKARVQFVWILSTDVLPQPRLKRGIWTTNGVWGADFVWYT